MATFGRQTLPFQVAVETQEAVTVSVSSTTFPSCKLNTVEGFATPTRSPGANWLGEVDRGGCPILPGLPSTSFGLVAFAVVHVAFTVQVLAPLAIVQLGGTVSVPVIGAVPTVIVTDCNGVVCPFPVH